MQLQNVGNYMKIKYCLVALSSDVVVFLVSVAIPVEINRRLYFFKHPLYYINQVDIQVIILKIFSIYLKKKKFFSRGLNIIGEEFIFKKQVYAVYFSDIFK